MQTRRDLLLSLASAASTTLALPEPKCLAQTTNGQAVTHPAPTADAIIVLWMAGGMAAPDTFDPKKYYGKKPIFNKGTLISVSLDLNVS